MKATPLLQKVCASGHFVRHSTDTGALICETHARDLIRVLCPPPNALEDSDWISLARAGVATRLTAPKSERGKGGDHHATRPKRGRDGRGSPLAPGEGDARPDR